MFNEDRAGPAGTWSEPSLLAKIIDKLNGWWARATRPATAEEDEEFARMNEW